MDLIIIIVKVCFLDIKYLNTVLSYTLVYLLQKLRKYLLLERFRLEKGFKKPVVSREHILRLVQLVKHVANKAAVVGLIHKLAIHLRAGLDDSCKSLPAQNIP